MITNDGFELKDGDPCFVSIQDPDGIRRYSPNPRKAVYRDEHAIAQGYDFTILNIRQSFHDSPAEIIAVWMNEPAERK